MKNLLVAAFVLVSAVSQAKIIEVERTAGSVRVNKVITNIVGEHGFPSTQVLVEATFGNDCQVPMEDEMVKIVNYTKNFDSLIIALGDESQRMCPAVFKPVTVKLDLGVFTRPNDGLFRTITVNQVRAE